MQLCLTAEQIDAAEAHRIGLVNKVVPAGGALAAAKEMAKAILANGPDRLPLRPGGGTARP